MKFGVHVSGAGGLQNIPQKAQRLGCATFQFFSRSPRGGRSVLLPETAAAFVKSAKELGFIDYYIHAPYYINLASADEKIYKGSVEILREELARSKMLGARGVIAHIGSASGMSHDKARERVIEAVQMILVEAPSILFLEISAGSGDVIGGTLGELQFICDAAGDGKNLKVALDTQHAFASGYDLRVTSGFDQLLGEYDRFFGLKNLEVIHVNDSKVGLGEKRDRHEEIGKGKLGLKAFRLLVNDVRLKNVNMVLETPKESDEDDLRNLSGLRSLMQNDS